MKKSKKFLLRLLYALCLTALLTAPILAADEPDPVEAPSEEELEPYAADYQTTEMTFSDYAVDFIIQHEEFTEEPYWDVSHWTVGYGSAYDKAVEMFPSIEETGVITEEQAMEVLMDDLQYFTDYLNDIFVSSDIVLCQNQFDALLSFTYNVGTGWWTYQNEDGSWCLLRQMLEDDPATWTEDRVKEAFGVWRTADGQVIPGLVNRRAEEAELFLTPDSVFFDVAEDKWYCEYVMTAYETGIMQGYGNGRFGPEDTLTRGEMVQALANYAGVDLTAYEGQTGGFPDVVEDAWYAPAVAWAAENNIVNGYDNGDFGPEDEIQRQHLCSIVARYLRTTEIEPPEDGDGIEPFLDDDEMQDTSRDDIYYCAALDLVNGVGGGYFNPQGEATRGELAKILVCMLAL